jgi:ABC-type sugar transport system substrate-binding protein
VSYARTLVTTAIVVGAVLAVAACGKSSDDDDKLSRTALPPKANPICAKAATALTAVRQPIGFTNPAQAGTYFRAVQRIRKKAARDLGKLEPDDDVKADYDAYLEAQSEELELVDRIVKKAEARDRSGLQDIKQLRPLARKRSAAARKTGLISCAD